ncbi:MAG: 30S ribosome-binding factor RbfA [Oscillospiraceae bacterium]|nr:30S ribosome-binding factor RbfA [Oscillospiraceae bacterium]MBQ2633389.1 30S ribosome-binding factor RbfA [Oscillospiraceae bacterium]MBR3860944.1 30S ribosome-binding factor RbfA [Oscillospiraceae bacterium]MBR6096532.1 30S ribosome-binding factor RbfA [Oscillospiraceae bacterium]
MASNKLLRTNEDIKFVLSRLLPQVKDPRVGQGKMLSITRVDTTGDLRYSKVYVSALGELDEKEFRRGIRSAAPWLRRELGSALSLRYTPELIFELDHSIEHGAYINSLIEKLDMGEKGEGEDADA